MLTALLLAVLSPVSPVPAMPIAITADGEVPVAPAAALEEMSRRKKAAKVLASDLPEGLDAQDQVRALVRRAVAGSIALGKTSELGRQLRDASRNALQSMGSSPKGAALLVDLVTEGALRDLAFLPTMEAPLPKGFPWPVPAGEIRVQEYPGYRKVVTGMQGSAQNGAFFKLFRHITSNDIAMTAPVEMTMGDEEMLDMAFLYGDPALGEAGDAGRVEVADIKPMQVVSIGIRGTTQNALETGAMEALEEWLKRNGNEWERAGNARLMGYNGPMTPRSKQYCEVQIPVQKKQK
jgi:hypothetical protein